MVNIVSNKLVELILWYVSTLQLQNYTHISAPPCRSCRIGAHVVSLLKILNQSDGVFELQGRYAVKGTNPLPSCTAIRLGQQTIFVPSCFPQQLSLGTIFKYQVSMIELWMTHQLSWDTIKEQYYRNINETAVRQNVTAFLSQWISMITMSSPKHSLSLDFMDLRYGPGRLMLAHRSIHAHPFAIVLVWIATKQTVGTNYKVTCLFQVIGVTGAPPFPQLIIRIHNEPCKSH